MALRTLWLAQRRFLAISDGVCGSSAGQQDLTTAGGEGILATQPGFERFTLLFCEVSNKDWCFHTAYISATCRFSQMLC
jgi:hypothetical protein